MNITQPLRHCPSCDSKPADQFLLGSLCNTHSAELSRPAFDLIKCPYCDVIYLSPLPTAEDFLSIYVRATQFIDDPTYTEDSRVKDVLKYMGGVFERLVKIVGIASADSPLKVLEIGAGYSWMSRAAKLSHWNVLTVAQDITPEVVNQCTWVDHYIVGNTDDHRIDLFGQYDIISMTHVIEHIPDPISVLIELSKRMSPSGVIFITAPYRPMAWTPDSGIGLWESYGYNHVPAHLQYYSRKGMEISADEASLELVSWDASHDSEQVFEAILKRKSSSVIDVDAKS